MRPVFITHLFCGDAEKSDTIYAREDITHEQIRADLLAAQEQYIAYVKSLSEAPDKVTAPYAPAYEDHPDKLVREVKAEWLELKAKAEAWNTHQRALRRPFVADFLIDNERYFAEDPNQFDLDLDWGHRHGWLGMM